MATIDLSTPPPPAAGALDEMPRRLTLTLPELRYVAEQAGGAPLPFETVPAGADPTLAGRLGGDPATGTEAEAYAAALAALHEPRASLARRGLLVDTVVDEGLLGAVGLLAKPAVAVDVEVAAGGARARAWHRQRAGAVASLASVDGLVFELAWFPVHRWVDELSRVAVLPEDHGTRESGVPGHVDLPYALLDAAGEAVRGHRSDLLSVLAAEHTGRARDGAGRAVPDLEVVTLLGALADESCGRLRALVADVSGDVTTVVGVVSWVLVADGWRVLRPRRADGVDRVVVERVAPGDLARELAPVLAEVAGVQR
ncbi:hypothetical protein [Nocardioides sp. T2.26MG-1]|uniref:hypothetical protein n=1 Tax=Nocardioides sp. T2.26MG-1 TaxID=3041166 RepID=UPI002477459E|nr:hypothetical protein [Nocardioides sp. T2.26MG-1]CAI9401278.1 hypothetical protein HIDPHFAB_00577 [Nocardioides sp. T2.26MG-1]